MAVSELLWTPSRKRVEQSRMYTFMMRVADRHGIDPEWETLRAWSVERPDRFWREMLDFAQIEPHTPCRCTTTGEGMLGTSWFPELKLNYARHMLRFDDDSAAILFENEGGQRARYTHRQLRAEVTRLAAALRRDGIGPHDRVAGFLPNIPETVIAMLATASLGAIWSSCSPDFGVGGVLDRFGQIEPSVLIVADGYAYGGKRHETLGRVQDMLARLSTVRRVVVVPYLDETPAPHWRDLSAGDDDNEPMLWREYLGRHDVHTEQLSFAEVPFDHPLFIMYSSGTTGVPKCIVHGHGGTLLQHMKELMLHTDLRAGERIFYFTTCGWMMWNWLVSSLGVGAALVLYDGSPTFPRANRLWELADQLRIDVFGTSPKFLGACQKANLHPGTQHDLSSLRAILSTGSPLSVEQFRWVYDEVKTDLQVSSISGGTDIISCFMLGNPMLPVYAGEIQCRGLGMNVQAWNDAGCSVVGEKGELVCCSPFPSQPVCFWNDPDGGQYRSAYFEHEWLGRQAAPSMRDANAAQAVPPPIWRHGDYIEITDTGGVIVYGRSDTTLNPGGVRIGTAEIYRIVESLPEVVDSIAVDRLSRDGDTEVVLFVVLREELKLDTVLVHNIRDAVAAGATRRHVPRHIRQVPAIPYTISGKKVELAVRQAIHGEDVANRDALANPATLDEFRDLF
jgi:acetoacetyl-CoA synthetase